MQCQFKAQKRDQPAQVTSFIWLLFPDRLLWSVVPHFTFAVKSDFLLFGGYYIFAFQQSINQLADMLIWVATSYYVEAVCIEPESLTV